MAADVRHRRRLCGAVPECGVSVQICVSLANGTAVVTESSGRPGGYRSHSAGRGEVWQGDSPREDPGHGRPDAEACALV
eukprot:8463432-Pyramimonas_sp.AAC.1